MMSETELEMMCVEQYDSEAVSVSGTPRLGNAVELAYKSDAGGAFGTTSLTEVRGELLYVTPTFGDDTRPTFVVRDSERERAVAVQLHGDMEWSTNVRSLAASRTKNGRRIGKLQSVTFTEDRVDHLAPTTNALGDARPGDTVRVDGTEYGVVSVHSYGPANAPDHFSAVLTRPDGSEYELGTYTGTNQVKFSERFSSHGEELDMDPASVQSARFRERFFSFDNEGLDTEDTTDAFPEPHGAREGERLTFALTDEDGEPTEQVSGEVTDVRYYVQTESQWFSDPEEQDPETTVELDDGREVVLKNTGRRSHSWVTPNRMDQLDDHGMVKAFVITRREDADNEYAHVEALDIQPEGGEDGGEDEDSEDAGEDRPSDVETDGGVVLLTDGGKDWNVDEWPDGYTADELALDGSEPRRRIGNAMVNLWDIPEDDLTARERSRLSTILSKLDRLETIIEEREVSEVREAMAASADREDGGADEDSEDADADVETDGGRLMTDGGVDVVERPRDHVPRCPRCQDSHARDEYRVAVRAGTEFLTCPACGREFAHREVTVRTDGGVSVPAWRCGACGHRERPGSVPPGRTERVETELDGRGQTLKTFVCPACGSGEWRADRGRAEQGAPMADGGSSPALEVETYHALKGVIPTDAWTLHTYADVVHVRFRGVGRPTLANALDAAGLAIASGLETVAGPSAADRRGILHVTKPTRGGERDE